MLKTIMAEDILPDYLISLWRITSPVGVLNFIMIVASIVVLCIVIIKLIAFSLSLRQKYVFLEVKPSYKSFKSSFSTEQLFTVLHAIQKPLSLKEKLLGIKRFISFELVSTKEEGIRYILRIPSEDLAIDKKALLAYAQSIEVTEYEDYLPDNNKLSVRELKLTRPYMYQLHEQVQLKESDPIAYFAGQMTKLDAGELLALQIVATPVTASSHPSTVNHVHTVRHMILNNEDITPMAQSGFVWTILKIFSGFKKKPISALSSSRQNQIKEVEHKIHQPLFESSVRLLVYGKTKELRNARMKGLLSSFETFASPSQGIVPKSAVITTIQLLILKHLYYFFIKNRLLSFSGNMILSSLELSSIYHFPQLGKSKTEDLIHNRSPKLPAPLYFKKSNPDMDIIFAENIYGETTTPIGLSLEERRRHVYAIGATGTGKTTLLLRMIYEDIYKGEGVAVLDPHGDLAERLAGIIPHDRIKDVIYFNPYDTDYPIGLNIMELAPNISDTELSREKDLIVSSIISVFHKLYPARYSGPRMEHVLRNTILTALEVEDPTLFTVYKLLTDALYRKKVVATLKDQVLKDYWKHEFEKLGSYQKAELISPITNKLGRFLTTSMTRNILNQKKSRLNFTDIMNSKKILICDLSKGKIGEDTSSFLGSLIVAKLQLAALNRVHIPQDQRTDFFVYIDEFQNFATTAFAQILSEARKYRLNTILAHQTVSQIEDKDLLKVILANVGTVISFRTSNPTDEEIILPLLSPQVEKNEISNLPSYNFYIKINALIPQDAFTGMTTNFSVPNSDKIREQVIQTSREHYGQIQKKSSTIKKVSLTVRKDKNITHEPINSVKKVRVAI